VVVNDSGSWIEGCDALCLTLTRTPADEAVLLLALSDLSEFPDVDAAEAWVEQATAYDRAWFATGTIDGWTFVWEENGWQGVMPEVALRLAGGGLLVSAFWNVNALMSFLVVDCGSLLRQFDPLFHDDKEPPTESVGMGLEAEAGLDWKRAPRLSSLTLLSTIGGTRSVAPSWLKEPGVRFWAHRF